MLDGKFDGRDVGLKDGDDGKVVGRDDGNEVGLYDGQKDGEAVGRDDGNVVGRVVGLDVVGVGQTGLIIKNDKHTNQTEILNI